MEQRHIRTLVLDGLLKIRETRPHARLELDEVCAVAGVAPADLKAHFGSVDEVVVSVSDECARASVAALQKLPVTTDVKDAIFLAHVDAMSALRRGSGDLEARHILGAMKEIAVAPALEHRVSTMRNRLYAEALADHLVGDVHPRSLSKAITIWSAVMSGVYVDLVGAHRRHAVTEDNFFDELVASMTRVYPLVTGRSSMS